MGDTINIFIDNLNALLWRLYELPFYFIVIVLVIMFMSLWGGLWFISKKSKRFNLNNKVVKNIAMIFIIAIAAIIVDHKLERISGELELLNDKYTNVLNRPQQASRKVNKNKLYDISKLKDGLKGDYSVNEQPINEAVDLIMLRMKKPLASTYIAVADLTNPNINVVLTPAINEKFLTSTFAKQNNCFLAINGEAGTTPSKNAPLGQWTGNYFVNGKALLKEDNRLRPFLSFDKLNKATYFEANIVDTVLTSEKYNTIWGRWDILIDGVVLKNKTNLKSNNRQYPRTIMGINKEGTILYLMIVDGRQKNYSLGLGLEDAASILKSLGASYAMACDQGGSSCMYIENRGIVNRPADGKERFTYTHFGLKMEN